MKPSTKKILVEGHRGYRPLENSMEGFKTACDLGVDGIETDIWLSKDNFIFINHGHTELGLLHLLDTESGRPVIKFAKDIVHDDIQKLVDFKTKKKLVLLESLFEHMRDYPQIYLSLEFKDNSAEAVRAVGELLTRLAPPNKVYFGSFDHSVKLRVAEQMEDFPVFRSIPFGFLCHNMTLLNDVRSKQSKRA